MTRPADPPHAASGPGKSQTDAAVQGKQTVVTPLTSGT
jgi:hypothetical protein